ncbi:hypothetical protein KKF92_00415 [Patescibacteria group bacterium]|nr:hypothetical protein [Patescibacteria group bacterium]
MNRFYSIYFAGSLITASLLSMGSVGLVSVWNHQPIGLNLNAYASSDLADYDFSAQAGEEHPFLLFNQSEVTRIIQRTQTNSVVAKALNIAGGRSNGDSARDWDRDLVDSSINYLVTADSTSRDKAIHNFVKHTSGPDKVIFQSAPSLQNYDYQGPCTSLALAYDFLYQNLNQTERKNGKQTLIDMADGIYNTYRDTPSVGGHNFSIGVIGCLGLIGMTLDGEHPQAITWREFTKQTLVNYLFDAMYNPDGDYIDGHTYEYYGQGAPILFAAAYKKKYGRDIIGQSGISNIWDYTAYELMSENKFPRYGDNSKTTMVNGENFYILQKKVREGNQKAPGWLWSWEQIRGSNLNKSDYMLWKQYDMLGILLYYPTSIVAQNPGTIADFKTLKVFTSNSTGEPKNKGGMAYLRSDWHNGDNLTLALINRWRWQKHQHYDPSHFVLSAFGEKLIVNENEWTYQDPIRGKLSQQNTMLFDTSAYDFDMPDSNFVTGTSPALGMFTNLINQSDADLITSDSRYPHNDWSHQSGIAQDGYQAYWLGNLNNITPLQTANRTIISIKTFAKYPYIIMLDEFNKDNRPHDYTWQAHLPLDMANYGGQGTAEQPIKFQKGNATLSMVFSTPTGFSQQLLPKEAKRNDWALQITQTNSVTSQILSLLLPTKNNESYTIQKTTQSNLQIFNISDGQRQNIILFNPEKNTVQYDQIQTNAQLLVVEKNSGNFVKYVLFNGNQLSVNDVSVLPSANAPNCTSGTNGKYSCVGTITAVVNTPTPTVTPQGCSEKRADINCDGLVDLQDYSILLSRLNFQ